MEDVRMNFDYKKTIALLYRNPALLFTIAISIVLSGFLMIYQPGFGYQITANGSPVGFVKHKNDIRQLSAQVDSILKEEWGGNIVYELELSHKKGRLAGVELTSDEQLQHNVIDCIDVYKPAYLIKSNTAFVMAVDSKETAEKVLNKVKEPYLNIKKNATVEFVQDVNIIGEELVPVDMVYDEHIALNSLNQPNYLASATRSNLVRGSLKHNKKTSTKPLVDVQVSYEETGVVEIEPSVEKRKNSSMTEGRSKVVSEGTPGKKEVQRKVKMINGEIVSQDVIYQKVLVSAKPKIIEYGTKPKVSGIVATACNYLGTPYVWGGTTPRGFDCSGFTSYVFRKKGIYLPRTSYEQARVGERVSRSNLKAGDLVCFPGHVGIYIGNDQFIHAPHPGSHVKIDSLSSRRNFTCGRRISY